MTGLILESPAELEARLAQQIQLPPCAGKEVKETLWEKPPAFFKEEDQQFTNMCAVNGGTSAMEVVSFLATGQMIQLSRNWLYLEAQKRCGLYGDQGVTLGSVIRVGKEVGNCREDLFPFRGFFDNRVPHGCAADAAKRKITATIDVRSGGYDSVRRVVGQNIGAILMASDWEIVHWDGFVVEQYQPRGRDGHARAYVFLAARLDSRGRPYVWCANSHKNMPWELWSPDAIDRQLEMDRFGTTGITGMTSPEPQEVDWAGALNPFVK